MNYQKKGLKKLLDDVLADKVERPVLTHKNSLLRFGADPEPVFAICEDTSFGQAIAGVRSALKSAQRS